MSQSTSANHTKSPPVGDHREHSESIQNNSGDLAASEAFGPSLDKLERSLQGLAGDGAQFSMDTETRTQNLLALQQTFGNQHSQRIIQRQAAPAPATAVPSPAPPVPDASLPEDLRTFRAAGPTPASAAGTTISPSTGMGGFNARYDPTSMVLTITLNLGMNFIDGMTISGNHVTATQTSMAGSAVQINQMLSRLRGARRTQALQQVREQWLWTGAADPRITAWMATYRSNVMGAWSSAGTGIIFQGSRAGWDTQLARVNVVVNTQNITSAAAGTPVPGPQPVHCKADIYKTPDADLFGAQVTPGTPASGATPATTEKLELGSGQVTPQAESHILTQSVFFANNSATLSGNAKNKLKKWIISFQATPGTAGNSISITGRANTKGDNTDAGRQRNTDLSFNRATAVENFISTTSVEGSLLRNAASRINFIAGAGASDAGEEAAWRRVDIVVGSGQGQNIAAHEFGHMLGLDDEYASTPKLDAAGNPVVDAAGNIETRGLVSGTGGEVGSTTGHNQLASDMGLGGSVHENNDNIMSLGSTIRPQHYATFMSALHTVTGVNDWKVKP